LEEINHMYQDRSNKGYEHRSTVKEPPSFKQLISIPTGRPRDFHRMSIDAKMHETMNFSIRMKDSSWKKSQIKAEILENRFRGSKDLDLVRSNSTPKMLTANKIKDLHLIEYNLDKSQIM